MDPAPARARLSAAALALAPACGLAAGAREERDLARTYLAHHLTEAAFGLVQIIETLHPLFITLSVVGLIAIAVRMFYGDRTGAASTMHHLGALVLLSLAGAVGGYLISETGADVRTLEEQHRNTPG